MTYNEPHSPLYQRCPHTNMLFAYYPIGPGANTMSALLRSSPSPQQSCYTGSNPSRPRKQRVSTRRRLASLFTRRSSASLDDLSSSSSSSLQSPSDPDSLSVAETLSDTKSESPSDDAKSVSRGIFRRRTTSSAASAKSSSMSKNTKSAKKAKKSVTFSDASPDDSGQQYLSNAYPSAWSYVVW